MLKWIGKFWIFLNYYGDVENIFNPNNLLFTIICIFQSIGWYMYTNKQKEGR